MSVWGSGDAEYFRAAIFRGSYTFRMARIETFSGRSGCQGTGLFLFFLPSFTSWQFYLWSIMIAYLDFPIFVPYFFKVHICPSLPFVMRNKWLFPFSLARVVKDRLSACCVMHVDGSMKPIKAHSSVSSFSCTVKSCLTQWIVLPARQEPGMIVREVTSIAFALNDLNG